MKITAKITGLEYKSSLTSELKDFEIKDFNINNLPSSSIIKDGGFSCGISKWVSPKRTRSYPYERIPIIKDEGRRGDRDFIQWDTAGCFCCFCIL